ncbi:hypothetical protein LIER_43215 [Lithospermum erythrorhizon]|uniref:Uncharacterized protein n=1 Tax=Lithospermum erythrorhizon TaxID=34254 RepID=A0AAV3PNC5_LITER
MTGTGILKDTPPSSPARENSPLRVIDVSTLHQVRLCATMGAKVRVENLICNPYSDPFAAAVLKKKQTQDDLFSE